MFQHKVSIIFIRICLLSIRKEWLIAVLPFIVCQDPLRPSSRWRLFGTDTYKWFPELVILLHYIVWPTNKNFRAKAHHLMVYQVQWNIQRKFWKYKGKIKNKDISVFGPKHNFVEYIRWLSSKSCTIIYHSNYKMNLIYCGTLNISHT